MKKWLNPLLREQALRQAQELCNAHDATLLYLIFFGSALYGTDGPNSDIDVRGIFAPSIERVMLGTASHSICLHTGDQNKRNTAEDIDIDLWSIKHWIIDLLRRGDTGAVDMLFSNSNTDCVIFKAPEMDEVFANTPYLINQSASETAIKYSLGQAKKYGIRGSRLGLFREVRKEIDTLIEGRNITRLRDILPALNEKFAGSPFYEMGAESVTIGGKTHMEGIPLVEFISRIDSELNKYGNRAEEALANNGVDFKALSHALRATGQHIELLRTGTISFPLAFRDRLIEVKSGLHPYIEVEQAILADIEKMKQEPNVHKLCWNEKLAECLTLKLSTKRISPPISPITSHVNDFLHFVEKEYDIRILLAVESGSRAWNMESNDSDFDVRFVYIHTPKWYLESCVKKRDDSMHFAPKPTPFGDIDAEGWDVTKAIDLFAKSNPSILEWIESPIIYKADPSFTDIIRQYSDAAFNSVAMYNHYFSLGRKCWKEYEKNRKLKNLCYAVRGMINAIIVNKQQILPPLDIFASLEMASSWFGEYNVPADFYNEIRKIIDRKQSGEKITGDAPECFDQFFATMLKSKYTCKEWKRKTLPTTALFLEILKSDAKECSVCELQFINRPFKNYGIMD